MPIDLTVLLGAAALWGTAIAIKAAAVVHRGDRYTIGMWDGGLLRKDVTLSRLGAQVKLVGAVLLVLGCVALLAGLVTLRPFGYVVMADLAAMVLCDFLFTA